MIQIPRPEYPRPQLRRQDWKNLNGEWSFAFDDSDVGYPVIMAGSVLASILVLIVGYTWWPLFSLLDWTYREGEKPAKDNLWQMGLYDLEPVGGGGFLRIETPVVMAFRTAAERNRRNE